MRQKLFLFAIVLLVVWAMKRYYADASADDLRWILSPAVRLAGGASGTSFLMEPGAGYLSRERLFLVEKSCAGINFMIAAFAMLAFVFKRRVTSWHSGAMVLAASLVAAYAAAVLVNAARIAIAMWLAGQPPLWSHVSPTQIHRIEGIVVYFAGLALLHEVALRVQRGDSSLQSRA